MKKAILLLIIFLLATCVLQAKIEGTYVINDINKKTSCYITFFDKNCYFIEFYRIMSDDVRQISMFSFGHFSLSKNEVVLLDAINDYKIRLEILTEQYLKINQGFPFLKNKIFSYQTNNRSAISEDYKSSYFEKTETELSIQKEINKYNLDDKCYILHDGLYSFAKYELKIEKDSSYVFSYEDIIISKGTWKRNNNILSLYDFSLQHSFFVFIEKKGLNCKFLPDIYQNDLFILDQ